MTTAAATISNVPAALPPESPRFMIQEPRSKPRLPQVESTYGLPPGQTGVDLSALAPVWAEP